MVLKEIGKLLKRNIRTTDIAGRYGGEEFAIILTQTDINGAKVSAERIRRNVEKHEFDGLERVTISLGVSSNKNCNSIDELIKRADEALYMAKKRGKNRVEIEGGGAPSI
jgi:polar amino acid transport system substrate-binding protein